MSEALFRSERRLYKAMNNNLPKSRERKHLSVEVCFEVPKLTNNTPLSPMWEERHAWRRHSPLGTSSTGWN